MKKTSLIILIGLTFLYFYLDMRESLATNGAMGFIYYILSDSFRNSIFKIILFLIPSVLLAKGGKNE